MEPRQFNGPHRDLARRSCCLLLDVYTGTSRNDSARWLGKESLLELNKLFHQPLRTKIAVLLAQNLEVDFSTLKSSLEVTDGLLGSHLKELTSAEYVAFEKSIIGSKSKTKYRLTKLGRNKFRQYLADLKELTEGLDP